MYKYLPLCALVAFGYCLPVPAPSDSVKVPVPILPEGASTKEPIAAVTDKVTIEPHDVSKVPVPVPILMENPVLAGQSPPKKVTTYQAPVPILEQKSDGTADGTYNWSFESADGTKAEQAAEVKTVKVSGENDDTKVAVEDVKGSYSYVDPDGKTHTRQYVANEYGFFIKGDDIFPEIASHLAYIESHPQPISSVGRKGQ